MRTRVAADVSGLDTSACGPRALTWWGTLAFMSLEGAGFLLGIGAYLYLMALAPEWPLGAAPPSHWPGTIVTVLLLISAIPNWLVDKWAHAYDIRKVRIGITIMTLFGIAPLVVRAFEFAVLHVRWDDNAYGSLIWFLLGLHTTHLATDVADTVVLNVLMFTKHGHNPRRFSDVSDNGFYWWFVILSWLPMYFLIYWVPRL